MEFLKELFNGGALTYDQLAAAAKGKSIPVNQELYLIEAQKEVMWIRRRK